MLDAAMNEIDKQIIDAIGVQTAGVIELFSPIIMACFVLYVLFIAITYMKSRVEITDIWWDLLLRFIGWALIIGIGLNMDNYTTLVVDFVNVLPNGLVKAITGNSATADIGVQLDTLIGFYIAKVNSLYFNLEYSDVGGHIIASTIVMIFVLCTFPFVIICSGLILISHLMTSILLVLGPLFIALALFPSTRRFFSLWISQLLKFTLILTFVQIFAAVQIPMLVHLISDGLDTNTLEVTAGLTFTSTFELGLVSLLFFIITLKVTSFANGLSKGLNFTGFKANS